jgi:hypothetical protein
MFFRSIVGEPIIVSITATWVIHVKPGCLPLRSLGSGVPGSAALPANNAPASCHSTAR